MKKTTLICIMTLMALAVMGVGFAMWSDSVSISASAETGELHFGYVSGSDMNRDPQGNPDSTCDLGLRNARQAPEGKDVGYTATALTAINGDGVLDTLTVNVFNAYPCYYNDVSWYVENSGTIPVIIQQAKLLWGADSLGNPMEYNIVSGQLYALCVDGNNSYSVVPVLDSSLDNLGQFYEANNAVIEFKWGDNVGLQLHPGDDVEQSFRFHVVQPAQQETTYTFGLQIQGIQWNESPIPGHQQL